MMNLVAIKFLAACKAAGTGGLICGDSLPQPATAGKDNILNNAFLIGFSIIGALAFLYLVIGGLRYITSGGNPEGTQKAKNQIVYSLIGLIITAVAATVVNFVIDKLK